MFARLIAIWAVIAIPVLSGWITHVVVCIQDENWIFLIAGAIMVPIAVVHGWGVWFGAW